jgi:hypothetical protein
VEVSATTVGSGPEKYVEAVDIISKSASNMPHTVTLTVVCCPK